MDNYSKYIMNPEEFILSYDVKSDGIAVKTVGNKNEKSPKTPATKANIKECEDTLKEQYITLIQKKDKILQESSDKRIIIFSVISIVLCIISAALSEFSNILGMIFCGASVSTIIFGSICTAIYRKLFKLKVNTYNNFLFERRNIEKANKKDRSITKNLSKKTTDILRKNTRLKNNDLIDDVFNINFMDKSSLIDLKKILQRYRIMEQEQALVCDNSKESKDQGRTRKRTPNLPNNGR